MGFSGSSFMFTGTGGELYLLSASYEDDIDTQCFPDGCRDVPEPSNLAILALGLIGFFAVRRRKTH